MSREVKLKVDWGVLSTKLLEVVGNGFAAAFGGDGLAGGISALFSAVTAIKADPDPGERAYALTMYSFGWALDELTAKNILDKSQLKERFQALMDRARSEVDGKEHLVPATFLDRPTRLPLYVALRDSLVIDRRYFRPNRFESEEDLRSRFDAAFERAMLEMRVRRPELWSSLADLLSSMAGGPVERRINWDLYRSA